MEKADWSKYDGYNLSVLSPREKEILQYARQGMSRQDIASKYGIVARTVSWYFVRIKSKLEGRIIEKKQIRSEARRNQKISEAQKYVGCKFNDLTIKEVVGRWKVNRNTSNEGTFVKCECKCGKIFTAPLSAVRAGAIKTCGHDRGKNLSKGRELSEIASVNGTLITAIDGRRKKNKNNTSGVKGVSYCKELKKYRAYINFQRKQYYLGLYDKKEDAESARKAAEKEIYGNFLEWYAREYPEQWRKIKKSDERGFLDGNINRQ